jgi:hypothetical protein
MIRRGAAVPDDKKLILICSPTARPRNALVREGLVDWDRNKNAVRYPRSFHTEEYDTRSRARCLTRAVQPSQRAFHRRSQNTSWENAPDGSDMARSPARMMPPQVGLAKNFDWLSEPAFNVALNIE